MHARWPPVVPFRIVPRKKCHGKMFTFPNRLAKINAFFFGRAVAWRSLAAKAYRSAAQAFRYVYVGTVHQQVCPCPCHRRITAAVGWRGWWWVREWQTGALECGPAIGVRVGFARAEHLEGWWFICENGIRMLVVVCVCLCVRLFVRD